MKAPSPNAAVIDIGSNSIRYMEAYATHQSVAPFHKALCTTRLGSGLIETGCLQEGPIAATIEAVTAYQKQAKEKGLPITAYATSAVRDAKNRQAFLERLYNETGITVRVLSGEEEARFACLGALNGREGGLVDIGGGSAQVALGEEHHSFPVGCVRLRDLFAHLPFEEANEQIFHYIRSHTKDLPPMDCGYWVGVGGSITTLGALQAGLTAYDPKALEQVVITKERLAALLQQLEAMGEDRKAHPLLAKRHDVILYGGAALAALMQIVGIYELHVSDADGMEGILLA